MTDKQSKFFNDIPNRSREIQTSAPEFTATTKIGSMGSAGNRIVAPIMDLAMRSLARSDRANPNISSEEAFVMIVVLTALEQELPNYTIRDTHLVKLVECLWAVYELVNTTATLAAQQSPAEIGDLGKAFTLLRVELCEIRTIIMTALLHYMTPEEAQEAYYGVAADV